MFYVTTPQVTFKTRIQTDEAPGFAWQDMKTSEMFNGRRVVLVALPGAFTPTCSSTHLPGYEGSYKEIRDLGIDEVYCISVNDSFVMNSWFKSLAIENVVPVPDGAAEFTRKMGFLIDKSNIGFGYRSWRYSMVIDNGIVEQMFIEPGFNDNVDGDPFTVSDAQTMVQYLADAQQAKLESTTNAS
jgi:peroxiredoxin|tara:strand:- start:44462 stop:45016 length:555 start_codon:yes stop_codon:yes gene_type:complete